MKIAFQESGGFAGLTRGCELDDAQLSEADARALRELVANAGISSSWKRIERSARDTVRYEIALSSDAGHFEVEVDDLSMPEALEPLIHYLSKRAKPR